MKFGIHWIIFIASLLTITPFKIYSSMLGTGFEKSVFFAIILAAIALVFFGFVFFSKDRITTFHSSKNPYIGIVSVVLSASFLWNALSYILCDTSNNSFIQTLLMFIFAVGSSITFILIALNYFLGQNMFKKAQIAIFFPVLWFTVKMIMFLSIEDGSPDPYNIILNSFVLLFLFYHTQIFVTAVEKNMFKKLFVFGLPSVILSLMYCIPEIASQMQSSLGLDNIKLSILSIQLILGLYIFLILIDIQRQINKNKQHV